MLGEIPRPAGENAGLRMTPSERSQEGLQAAPAPIGAFASAARCARVNSPFSGRCICVWGSTPETNKRAETVDGWVKHFEPFGYPLDPLNLQGILAFLDIGRGLPQVAPCAGLKVKIVRGPLGDADWIVWLAERQSRSL